MNHQDLTRRAQDLRARLITQGVAVVTAEYDGYADSGMFNEIDFRAADNTPATVSSELGDEVIDLLYDLLDVRFPWWEDNLGALGDFVWDIRTDALHHRHHARFEDYKTWELGGWDAAGAAEPEAEAAETEEGR